MFLIFVGFVIVFANQAVTVLQLAPFLVLLALAYVTLYEKKKFGIFIVAVSVVMLLINLVAVSWIDVTLWAMGLSFLVPSGKRKKK